jgi:fatty-acyl-CoA synthase
MTATQAYWPADTSVPLCDLTVGELLREAAAEAPEALALVAGARGDDRRWTFAGLLAESQRAAAALLDRFEPGERVAMWAPNLPEWVVLEYGAALAGIVLVTVNPAYQRQELAHVLGQSRASGIVLMPEWRGNAMRASMQDVRPDLPDLREAILLEEWAEACAGAKPGSLPAVGPADPAQIQYTSGTTGFPKGALLRHGALTDNAACFARIVELGPGDVYVNPMPMFHTAGCVLGALGTPAARAAHVPVLMFEPGHVLELIERERGTILLGVPTLLIACIEYPGLATRDLSSFRSAVSGGSLVPAELVRRIETTLGVRFCIVYGTTECSPLVTMTRFDDTPQDKAETIGRPLPQIEVKVAEPATGLTAALAEVGELCARGYMVMTGYYDNPGATAEAIDAEGWYHTGDLASMDERGCLRIEGRLKDVIIRGGENIYPRENENVLFAHPAISEVAVVGIPDDTWGEQVAAFVRLAPGASATGHELFAYMREHLAPFKTPRHWIFLDEFPLTASGKIKKYVLRERLVTGELAAAN